VIRHGPAALTQPDRGCGFFTVQAGRITFQRGYWDKLSFPRMHGLPSD
jgi:hypothetical protein